MKVTARSPYLRDRLAEMPVFRDRERPLPMRPDVRFSHATAAMLPPRDRAKELEWQGTNHIPAWHNNGLPPHLAAIPPFGFLEWHADDSMPDGIIEIDVTRITIAEMRAACEGQ